MKRKSKLYCYPCLPPTSPQDPNEVLLLCIVRAHEEMLKARGVPLDGFATCSELVRANLLIQHWESVMGLGAYLHEPFASDLAKPGRAALVAAIRGMDGDAMFAAYRASVEHDGLSEIAKDWGGVVNAYGLDKGKEKGRE